MTRTVTRNLRQAAFVCNAILIAGLIVGADECQSEITKPLNRLVCEQHDGTFITIAFNDTGHSSRSLDACDVPRYFYGAKHNRLHLQTDHPASVYGLDRPDLLDEKYIEPVPGIQGAHGLHAIVSGAGRAVRVDLFEAWTELGPAHFDYGTVYDVGGTFIALPYRDNDALHRDMDPASKRFVRAIYDAGGLQGLVLDEYNKAIAQLDGRIRETEKEVFVFPFLAGLSVRREYPTQIFQRELVGSDGVPVVESCIRSYTTFHGGVDWKDPGAGPARFFTGAWAADWIGLLECPDRAMAMNMCFRLDVTTPGETVWAFGTEQAPIGSPNLNGEWCLGDDPIDAYIPTLGHLMARSFSDVYINNWGAIRVGCNNNRAAMEAGIEDALDADFGRSIQGTVQAFNQQLPFPVRESINTSQGVIVAFDESQMTPDDHARAAGLGIGGTNREPMPPAIIWAQDVPIEAFVPETVLTPCPDPGNVFACPCGEFYCLGWEPLCGG